jgi:uncharacterized protein YndB with AHSA1/START domain
MELKYNIDIDSPPSKVFDLVADADNLKQWMEGLQESVYLSDFDPDNPVGTRYRQKIKQGDRVVEFEGEITAYDRPHRFSSIIASDQYTVHIDFQFSEIESGTHLDYLASLTDASWTVRLLASTFSSQAQKIVDKQMKNLKTVAEAG